jgi:cyclopropane-fatty-acyl-phospholipid synthase
MKSPGDYQAGMVQPAAKHSDMMEQSSNEAAVFPEATNAQRIARGVLFKLMAKITHGCLVIDEAGQVFRFGDTSADALTAHVVVNDPAIYQAILIDGSIGAAESYMQDHWHTPDLVTVVRIMVLNMEVLQGMDDGKSNLRQLMNKLMHWRNRNSVHGSRKNIAAHYDLSNTFFASFLDPSMMYSAAVFRDEAQTLHEASISKLTHICERLQLQPTDHLVEIGTGWGSMAIHAAKYYGCRVTTTTISQQQYEFASARVAAEGLEDRITLLLKDYRDLEGKFDKLVSVEMIEAVGHRFFGTYFAKCSSLLKPEGLMLIQAITISDQRYGASLRSVDFIQRYIFPGGCLPCNNVIASHVAKDTDLQIVGLEDITRDYAMTLERWRKGFLGKVQDIQAMGFGSDFIKMWDFYLAYCQGGFMERVIHTAQFVMAKPRAQLKPLHARIPANR